MQGVNGEAVVSYRKPLTTRHRPASAAERYHRLVRLWLAFRKGKQLGKYDISSLEFTIHAFVLEARKFIRLFTTFALSHSCQVVYVTLGYI
jgi:hypothetical protein